MLLAFPAQGGDFVAGLAQERWTSEQGPVGQAAVTQMPRSTPPTWSFLARRSALTPRKATVARQAPEAVFVMLRVRASPPRVDQAPQLADGLLRQSDLAHALEVKGRPGTPPGICVPML